MKKGSIIAAIIAFLAGIFAGNHLCKTSYYFKAKEIAKELLSNTAESICPCELILVTRYNQKEESTITDFSQYKTKKRVGLIINTTKPHPNAENGEENLDDDIFVYPLAVVYKIGETWLWKVL